MFSTKNYLFIIFLILITFSKFLFSNYVAKINNKEISTREFQKFINIRKFITNSKSTEDLLKLEKSSLNDLLKKYIEATIILIEAKKNKYTINNQIVKKQFADIKDIWLIDTFVKQKIDTSKINITEKELRNYSKLPKELQPNKSFDKLSPQEKYNLGRIMLMQKSKSKIKSYQSSLSRKYKVKINDFDKNPVAFIGKEKISKKEFYSFAKEKLSQINRNLTPEILKQQNPAQYKVAMQEIIENLLLTKLVKKEIKRTRFEQKSLVKDSLEWLKKEMVMNTFLKNELAESLKPTNKELDAAFVEISKLNPNIQRMLPTEQEKALNDYIAVKKLPALTAQYLSEKTEESIIKRNKKELKKIK